MCDFEGRLLEYPFLAVDNFTTQNLSCSGFFLSHCHTDHMKGLTTQQFENTLKSRSGVFLYCSETTKNLLTLSQSTEHLVDHVIGIPISQPTLLKFHDVETEEGDFTGQQEVLVTLIPAGHCVGSVMFLFQGANKTALYTGDFRLTENEIHNIPVLKSGKSVIQLNSMYVDTTFCSPKSSQFPSREESKKAMIKIISSVLKQGKQSIVHINCSAKYGYEYILMGIAEHFKTKIHVDAFKMNLYSAIPHASHYFTSDRRNCQIHSCYVKQDDSCPTDLPCGLRHVDGLPVNLTRIKPSTMYFAMQGKVPDDNTIFHEDSNFWRVFHSMHASMDEICRLANYLKPRYIYPFVIPFDAKSIVTAYERLKQYTSCDLNGFAESKREVSGSDSKISPDRTSWKEAFHAGPINSPVRVKNLHKSLGLNMDIDFVPPLRRRKMNDVKREESKSLETKTSNTSNWEATPSTPLDILPEYPDTKDREKYHDDLEEKKDILSSSTGEEFMNNDSEETYFSPGEDSQNLLNSSDVFDIPGSPDYDQPSYQDLKELHEKVQCGEVLYQPSIGRQNLGYFLTLEALERIE